jgi:hypothetical protein
MDQQRGKVMLPANELKSYPTATIDAAKQSLRGKRFGGLLFGSKTSALYSLIRKHEMSAQLNIVSFP